MLNNSFTLRMAGRFAARVAREAPGSVENQIARAYDLAFGRRPRPDETAQAARLVRDHGLPALCRVIFNSNEFLYVD